jgi:hypothetical protein
MGGAGPAASPAARRGPREPVPGADDGLRPVGPADGAPHGLAGGEGGRNTLLHVDGTGTDLGGTAKGEAGDRLRTETPGGDGYGPPA